MFKYAFTAINSTFNLFYALKHLSISQWDVEESERIIYSNSIRQQR
jgi:hypothetical protein